MYARSSSNSYNSEVETESCGCQISRKKRLLLPYLQYFANLKFALAVLCLVSIAQGFVLSGLYSVVVSTIEKRFHLRSTESGLIASSANISSCLSVLFVAYLGGRGHKPLWIGWGIFLMGIGAITFSLPHFFAPSYKYGTDVDNVCNATIVPGECIQSSLRKYIGLFVVAMLLNGLGGTTISTLGVTYLDENVVQVKSSLYHGIYFASGAIGPALGFMFGGRLLTLYTNIFEKVSIDDSSSQWIGAWWLGYLVGGIIIIALSIPILLLPKQLPNHGGMMNIEDRTPSQQNNASISSRYGVVRSIINLFRNPTFSLITLAACFGSGLMNGISTFGLKYMQSMYHLSPSQAANYFGVLAILAGATGQCLGGVIVTKFKLDVSGILKFCCVCVTISTLSSLVFFITCPNVSFAGATTNYSVSRTSHSSSDFNSTCNLPCNCNLDFYAPVCGEDNITYYSPCFAGCQQKDGMEYVNCSCILDSTSNRGGSSKDGQCSDQSCGRFPLFLTFFYLLTFFTFLIITPAVQVILRVVPFNNRSLAIGVKYVVLNLFGSIPGPIIFGRVLDLACVVWSTECGEQGSCELYDNSDLASNMAALILAGKVFIVLLFGAAWWIYKPTSKQTSNQEQDTHVFEAPQNSIVKTRHYAQGEDCSLLRGRTMSNVNYSI